MTNKYRKNKGNISILVIFVLLASSIIGIITSNFIKSLSAYNNLISGYYKTYYLSKAGLELGLTQIKNNGIGFENTINTGDSIVDSNFVCSNCNFLSNVISQSDFLSLSQNTSNDKECTKPFILKTGDNIIIPLFYQINSGSNIDKLSEKPTFENIYNHIKYIKFNNLKSDTNNQITIGILSLSGGDLLQDSIFSKSFDSHTNTENIISNFENEYTNYAKKTKIGTTTLYTTVQKSHYQSYLIVGNTENKGTLSFCIDISTDPSNPQTIIKFPNTFFYIQSIGSYNNQKIGLEGFIKQSIPEFLGHTYLDLK